MKKGDIGLQVSELQRMLGIATDGIYGDSTVDAVKAYQKKHGLIADGIAGEKTTQTLRDGKPDGKHLTHADIEKAAETLGVETACVLAINAVESTGSGFLPDGRPKILFERHIMYRQLKAAGFDADDMAKKYPNLVNPLRGGYAGGAAEHGRYNTATGIDLACAIESTSWGLFQIMGYHWKALQYASASEFSMEMYRGESNQLQAFVRFIQSEPAILKALKAKKWEDFAKLYNGQDYKDNDYDIKLAKAYQQHA